MNPFQLFFFQSFFVFCWFQLRDFLILQSSTNNRALTWVSTNLEISQRSYLNLDIGFDQSRIVFFLILQHVVSNQSFICHKWVISSYQTGFIIDCSENQQIQHFLHEKMIWKVKSNLLKLIYTFYFIAYNRYVFSNNFKKGKLLIKHATKTTTVHDVCTYVLNIYLNYSKKSVRLYLPNFFV